MMWEQLITLTHVGGDQRCSGLETLKHVSIGLTLATVHGHSVSVKRSIGTFCLGWRPKNFQVASLLFMGCKWMHTLYRNLKKKNSCILYMRWVRCYWTQVNNMQVLVQDNHNVKTQSSSYSFVPEVRLTRAHESKFSFPFLSEDYTLPRGLNTAMKGATTFCQIKAWCFGMLPSKEI